MNNKRQLMNCSTDQHWHGLPELKDHSYTIADLYFPLEPTNIAIGLSMTRNKLPDLINLFSSCFEWMNVYSVERTSRIHEPYLSTGDCSIWWSLCNAMERV